MNLSKLAPGPIPVFVKTPDTGKSSQGQGQLIPVPTAQRGSKAGGDVHSTPDASLVRE